VVAVVAGIYVGVVNKHKNDFVGALNKSDVAPPLSRDVDLVITLAPDTFVSPMGDNELQYQLQIDTNITEIVVNSVDRVNPKYVTIVGTILRTAMPDMVLVFCNGTIAKQKPIALTLDDKRVSCVPAPVIPSSDLLKIISLTYKQVSTWTNGGQMEIQLVFPTGMFIETGDQVTITLDVPQQFTAKQALWGLPANYTNIKYSQTIDTMKIWFTAEKRAISITKIYMNYLYTVGDLPKFPFSNAKIIVPGIGNRRPIPGSISPIGAIKAFDFCGKGKKVIALTHDDGPKIKGIDTMLLSVLQKHGVTSTFFLAPASDPDSIQEKCVLAKQMKAAGHAVENHSWTHRDFATLTTTEIKDELDKTNTFIKQCTGDANSGTLFRPPFGSLTQEQAVYITSLGYTIAFWDVDTLDFSNAAPLAVEAQFTKYFPTGDGPIILTHDDSFAAIADQVLTFMKNSHPDYKFVSAVDCYAACGQEVCSDPNRPHFQIGAWAM